MIGFRATLGRDLLIARREGGEALLAVIFFVLGTVLFPLGVGLDIQARLCVGEAIDCGWRTSL